MRRPLLALLVPFAPLVIASAACGSGPTQTRSPAVAKARSTSASPSASTGTSASPPTATSTSAATASSTAAATAAATATPAQRQRLASLQALAAAITAHDAKRIADAYAPDAELTVIPEAGVLRGRDKIAADETTFFQAFPDYVYALRRVWLPAAASPSDAGRPAQAQAQDVAIVESVGEGTNTGDFLGLKATGRRAGQRALAIYWFSADGKIAREHLYEDGASLLAQLAGQPGAPPVPPLPEQPTVYYGAPSDAATGAALRLERAYIDAWQKKDEARLLSLLSDDFEFEVNLAAAPDRGKDQAKKAFQRFTTAFPDAKWNVSDTWVVGDFVVFEVGIQATQDGAIGPLPPTHRKVDWHWARILEVSGAGEGAKIARGWGYANTIELLGELGTMGPADHATPPKR